MKKKQRQFLIIKEEFGPTKKEAKVKREYEGQS